MEGFELLDDLKRRHGVLQSWRIGRVRYSVRKKRDGSSEEWSV